MQLTHPLVALDVETHAKCKPEQARIVEIGMHIEYPDGRPPKTWCGLFNPGVPITAHDVHGITDDKVASAHPFAYYAKNLAAGFSDCDFCGYNVRFDLDVIQGEMNRAGVKWNYEGAHLLDGLRLWQLAKPRTLTEAVKEFLGREPTEALGDAEDALAVAQAMLERFSALPQKVDECHLLCFPRNPLWVDSRGKIVWREDGEAQFSFGKHQSVPLRKVPRSYFEWIMGGDFPREVKQVVEKALKGEFPKR
ncbi:MAG: 3'-5' exonuclease [Bryobacteraceae bacterium]